MGGELAEVDGWELAEIDGGGINRDIWVGS